MMTQTLLLPDLDLPKAMAAPWSTPGAPASGHPPLYEFYAALGTELVRVASDVPDDPQRTRERYTEGARALSLALLEGCPPERVQLQLARAFDALGRVEDALRSYLDAAARCPDWAASILPRAESTLTPELAKRLAPWIRTEWVPRVSSSSVEPTARRAFDTFLGRFFLCVEEPDLSVHHYERAAAGDTSAPGLLEGLGRALLSSGRAGAAVGPLTQAVERADGAGDLQASLRLRRELASALLESGDIQGASRVVRCALRVGGASDPALWTALARVRAKRGLWDAALRASQRALECEPHHLDANVALASVQLQRGDYEDAIAACERVIDVQPHHVEAVRLAARALIQSGKDVKQGVLLMSESLAKKPGDAASRLFLARSMRDAGYSSDDVVELLQAGVDDPAEGQVPELRIELAEALCAGHSADAALSVVERLEPGADRALTARLWQVRGEALVEKHAPERALLAFERALESEPASVNALRARARCSAELATDDAAIRAWEQAVAAAPAVASFSLELARAQARAGQRSEAWAAVCRALELSVSERREAIELRADLAEDRPVHDRVAAWYDAGLEFFRREKEGDRERALEYFEKVCALDPLHDARFYTADTRRLLAVRPLFPYIDAPTLALARADWVRALDRATPGEPRLAWAYVTGALIFNGLAELASPPDLAPLIGQALTYLELSLAMDTTNAYSWVYLARIYRSMDLIANTLLACERARALDRDEPQGIEEQIATFLTAGQSTAARELIDEHWTEPMSTWQQGAVAYLLVRESRGPHLIPRDLDKLNDAIARLNIALGADPTEPWALSFRAECQRWRAVADPAQAEEARRLARADCETLWSMRTDPKLTSQPRALANAAYFLGELESAQALVSGSDPLDVVGQDDRLIGCCQLRLGRWEEGRAVLVRSIEKALTTADLETLALRLEEMKRPPSEGRASEQPVPAAIIGDLLSRVEAGIARMPLLRSPRDELQTWQSAAIHDRSHGWLTIAARAGQARLALAADQLEPARDLYRSLLLESARFPEARRGLMAVASRHRTLGYEALAKASPSESTAIQHFQAAADVAGEAGVSAAESLAGLGVAELVAGAPGRAVLALSAALGAAAQHGDAEPVPLLLEAMTKERAGVTVWDVDRELSDLAGHPETPEPLREVLGAVRAALRSRHTQLPEAEAATLAPFLPIIVKIPESLVPSDDDYTQWPLFKRWIPELRDRIRDAVGIVLPGVRFRGDDAASEGQYTIAIQEVAVERASVPLHAGYSPRGMGELEAAGVPVQELIEQPHPLSGEPGYWVPQAYFDELESARLELWRDPLQFIMAHLEFVLRRHAAAFFGLQEQHNLIQQWAVSEARRPPAPLESPDLQRLNVALQRLLREDVPIANAAGILDTISSSHVLAADPDAVNAALRAALREDLPGNQPEATLISVPPELEREMLEQSSRFQHDISLQDAGRAIEWLDELAPYLEENRFAVLITESEAARRLITRVVRLRYPGVSVQTRQETTPRADRSIAPECVTSIPEWSLSGGGMAHGN